jgi:hypothetical protein
LVDVDGRGVLATAFAVAYVQLNSLQTRRWAMLLQQLCTRQVTMRLKDVDSTSFDRSHTGYCGRVCEQHVQGVIGNIGLKNEALVSSAYGAIEHRPL